LTRPLPAAADRGSDLSDCSLLVAIAAHYVPARIPYLLDVLRALADFPLPRLDVKVMVNELDVDTLGRHQRLLASPFGAGASLEVVACGGLDHPFKLTWAHKALIRDVFLAADAPWTHFLYLEDDMRFGLTNLRYFLRMRPMLAPHRLIPSFLRTEYAPTAGELRFLDQLRLVDLSRDPVVQVGTTTFTCPDNPYCALFLLDRELAEEHMAGRSSDMQRSTEISHWDIRARAASGLCWDTPPPGFPGRFVVPVDPATGAVPPECWVPHLAARYADNRRSRFGKLVVPRLVARRAE
jgi:hypothetical protein